MKHIITLLLLLSTVSTSWAQQPITENITTCPIDTTLFPKIEASTVIVTDTTQIAKAEKEARRRHFLPMRRRIDREINKNKFAYKGEIMLGATASYGTLSSDNTDFMLILDNFNADGTIASVKPFIGYFYRDNNCIGVRFGYQHIGGTLGNINLDLGENNNIGNINIGNMDLSSNNFSFGLFHRSYVGLDKKGHFGLFADLELAFITGTSSFSYKTGDTPRKTFSDNFQVKLSFNPGVAVYIFPNVCGTLSFGLGGIQYTSVTQKNEQGVKVGSRSASKMRFRLNLLDINIGMVIHLWDKKKQ
ncbi:MAG: hypothetical protein RR330_04310 [Alistipes sp.]